MGSPKRIQRQRAKGWRLPDGAVNVTRPTKWGNPWRVALRDRAYAVERFETYLRQRREHPAGWTDVVEYPSDDEIRAELAGKDLACWCPLDQPCHADVLLKISNGGEP